MNRPLAAFGALMTFLVLAMFAVSSTSRSTSVQAVRPAKRMAFAPLRRSEPAETHVASISKPVRTTFGCASGEAQGNTGLAGDCGAVGFGGEIAENLLASLMVDRQPQAELMTVRIVAADAIGEEAKNQEPKNQEPKKRRTKNRRTKNQEPEKQGPEIQEPIVAEDELTAVFFGLVDAKVRRPGAAEEAVGTAQATEYAGWVDRAGSTAETAKTSGKGESVRSGDWLRHSAALSLYRVGSLLQAAALEVGQTGGPSAARGTEGVAR